MNTAIRQAHTKQHATSRTVQLVCWMFQRGSDAATCEVDFDPRRSSYEVYVTPPRGSSDTLVERFDRASSALQRHAEIASMLRQSGWTVSGYGHLAGHA